MTHPACNTHVYQEAERLIDRHPGTGGATGLMRLILSLYNGDEYPYAFSVCIQSFSPDLRRMALEMVFDYAKFGENNGELLRVGSKYAEYMSRIMAQKEDRE